MATRSNPIERCVQLLVEGNDQRNFFEAMVERLALAPIQVRNFGGVGDLRGFLAAFVLARDFKLVRRLGIVRDAEASAEAAFMSVQSSLRAAGLSLPEQPAAEAVGEPSVSALILPGGSKSGMLETLLCRTFQDTAMDRCIDALFDCAQSAGESVPKRPEKARARVWLATKPDPHLSVGVAAKRGYWDMEHPALAGVRSYLKELGRPAE